MTRRRLGLSIAQQAIGIRGLWPTQPRPRLQRGTLHWTGHLQPSAISPTYTVSLAYQHDLLPKVHVVTPRLDPGLQEALPHVYREGNLCLYTEGDWKPSMLIADTIIPWTAEWLFHYEAWRATGRWEGGE